MSRRLHFMAQATVLGMAAMAISGSALGSGVVYRYDKVGRLTTALYDNGLCVAYAYDANGNRISQTNSTAIAAPVWGTGTFGCFNWTP